MAEPSEGRASERAPQLRRAFRAHHLFALAFGTIVGTGWITGLGIWVGAAGSFGSIVGFALGGLVMILIAICYAQLALRFPNAGGEIAYAQHLWGADAAFITGWLMVLIYVTAISFQTVALAWIMEVLVSPAVRGPALYTVFGEPVYLTAMLMAVAVGAGIAWLNHRGVTLIARFQSIFTFAKIAIGVAFFFCAFGVGDWSNLEPKWSRNYSGFSTAGMWTVFATAPFFLAGFDVVPLAMGEKSDATGRRSVYIATVGSLVAAVAFYALVILCGALVVPRSELLAAELPTVVAFEHAFGSPLLARLALAAGLMGVLTCWNSSVFGAGRVLYAMGESNMIPPWFAKLHARFATPYRATLFAGVVGLLLVPFGKSVIYPVVNTSGSSFALIALIVCFGLLRARWRSKQSGAGAPLVSGGWLLLVSATLGAAFVVVLSLHEAWQSAGNRAVPLEWWILVGWAAIGAVFWLAVRQRSTVLQTSTQMPPP